MPLPVTTILPIYECADRLGDHLEKAEEWLDSVEEVMKFGAILINRRACADADDRVSGGFIQAGCRELMRNSDFVVLEIPNG
jgi:hypothetical protein